MGQNAIERRPQVARPRRRRIVGVVGEHIEQVAPQDRPARGHGGAQVRIADRDDDKGGGQYEVRSGRRLEQGAEVRGRERSGSGFGRNAFHASARRGIVPLCD